MYIDSSRRRTLMQITKALRDPLYPPEQKRKADRIRAGFQQDAKDAKFARLREQLDRAAASNDKLAMWKLTCQIKDYKGEEVPVDML